MTQSEIERLADYLQVPCGVVRGLESIDFDAARELGRRNLHQPESFTEAPPVKHSLMIDALDFSENDEAAIAYYDVIDSKLLISSELEQDIKNHPSYKDYVMLSRFGSEPPPIGVTRTVNGELVSRNRRRTLVAKELGKSIGAWVESDTVGKEGFTLSVTRYKEAKTHLGIKADQTANKEPQPAKVRLR